MKKKDFTIYIFFKIYSKKFNKINFKNNKTKMINKIKCLKLIKMFQKEY